MRQDVGGNERRGAQGDGLSPAARAASDAGHGFIELLEMPARCIEQVGAVARELDLPCRAVEQAVAELVLEFADQHAQARRRDEERLGRSREAAMVGHEMERPKLSGRELRSIPAEFGAGSSHPSAERPGSVSGAVHDGNRQEIDNAACWRIRYVAKSLSELVELMGIEPMTS